MKERKKSIGKKSVCNNAHFLQSDSSIYKEHFGLFVFVAITVIFIILLL